MHAFAIYSLKSSFGLDLISVFSSNIFFQAVLLIEGFLVV